jgi:FAD:protein FMN transferase
MTTRRNLLFAMGAGAAGLALWPHRSVTVSRPGTAFGTTVNITVTTQNEMAANRAIDAGYRAIRAVHKAASLFDPNSEVSRLNRTRQLDSPSAVLRDLVLHSENLHRATNGAFDPSVQPLWNVWSQAAGTPADQDIAKVLKHVGWHNLSMSENELSLNDGAALTFNGIAQGYAADLVMRALQAEGVLAASIDTGETGRRHADGTLLIQNPRSKNALGELHLRDGFVAVSGDYATRFTDDFAHHHIFDPALGFSPRELASVAVVAPAGAEADGLATAFMVMGVARSLACLETQAGCHALFVDKAGNLILSPGMKPLFKTPAA